MINTIVRCVLVCIDNIGWFYVIYSWEISRKMQIFVIFSHKWPYNMRLCRMISPVTSISISYQYIFSIVSITSLVILIMMEIIIDTVLLLVTIHLYVYCIVS